MRRARFIVSSDLLRDALKMPMFAEIVGARMHPDLPGVIEFIADDYTLPEADEPHDTMPLVTHERFVWDWNVKPDATLLPCTSEPSDR